MQITSAELLRHHTEPQSQQKLPQSLNIYVKSFNTENMYVSFFIEPLKGQEVIKSVLIVN